MSRHSRHLKMPLSEMRARRRLGDSLADRGARKGALLWKAPSQKALFLEACEDTAAKLVRWIGHVHAWIGDHGAWDTGRGRHLGCCP
eukprot:7024268-Pyramimonas_sp.AAC.1